MLYVQLMHKTCGKLDVIASMVRPPITIVVESYIFELGGLDMSSQVVLTKAIPCITTGLAFFLSLLKHPCPQGNQQHTGECLSSPPKKT